MAEVIPVHVFERLEREWRLVEPEREIRKPAKRDREEAGELKRLMIGRVD